MECVGWQCGCGGAANALHAVFEWLEGEELSCVAAVCRAWREAANAPALWRAALARRARLPQEQLRRLAADRRSRREPSGLRQPLGNSPGVRSIGRVAQSYVFVGILMTALDAESDSEARWAEAAWWRGQFALAAAGWRARGRHALGAGAVLLHAALAEQTQERPNDALALAAEDATLTVHAHFLRE